MNLKDITFDFLYGKWHTNDLHFLVVWQGGVRFYKQKVETIKITSTDDIVSTTRMPVLEKEYDLSKPIFRYDPNNLKYWITDNLAILVIDEENNIIIEYNNILINQIFKKD
jgi:hypothetical protein